jgi:hypothetical protein
MLARYPTVMAVTRRFFVSALATAPLLTAATPKHILILGSARAIQAGLNFRPYPQTVTAHSLTWAPAERPHQTRWPAPEKEAEPLAKWKASKE